MSAFERYLTVWVALCIVAGIALGQMMSGLFETFAGIEYASVNLVVAVLIWAMVYPMMIAVDFASLHRIKDQPKGLVITLVVNWLIKPFTMALLGVWFCRAPTTHLQCNKQSNSSRWRCRMGNHNHNRR